MDFHKPPSPKRKQGGCGNKKDLFSVAIGVAAIMALVSTGAVKIVLWLLG